MEKHESVPCITNPEAELCMRDEEDKVRSSSTASFLMKKATHPTNSETVSSYKKTAINPR